jgi:hypothetical protein
MPEGTAQNIMPSTREDLPVLAIYCDEQTSKAGMLTRLEAFVDMLRMKKAGTAAVYRGNDAQKDICRY